MIQPPADGKKYLKKASRKSDISWGDTDRRDAGPAVSPSSEARTNRLSGQSPAFIGMRWDHFGSAVRVLVTLGRGFRHRRRVRVPRHPGAQLKVRQGKSRVIKSTRDPLPLLIDPFCNQIPITNPGKVVPVGSG